MGESGGSGGGVSKKRVMRRERERDATNEVKSERSGRTGVDLVGYGQGCLGGVGWAGG